MQAFQVPAWVNKRMSRGAIELLGRSIVVSLDEAELIGERIAILTADDKCGEGTAQRAVLDQLMARRRAKEGREKRDERPGPEGRN